MLTILITDDVHPILIDTFIQRGHRVDYQPNISLEQCTQIISNYNGIVINTKIKATREFINRGKQLKWIARLGSGMEIIDAAAAAEQSISLISTPEANSNAVGEHCLALLMHLLRNIGRADRQVKDLIWERELNRGNELDGKTVGLIGFGHTGPAFAKKLMGFDCQVLVYDKYRKQIKHPNRLVQECSLEDLQKQAEIISLHVPLTAETKGMVDNQFIDQCVQSSIILINTSRGAVVHTPSLLSAMESGKIRAAGLDVFENEKVETFTTEEASTYAKLYKMDQFVCTPHIAGWTFESKKAIADVMLSKLAAKNLI